VVVGFFFVSVIFGYIPKSVVELLGCQKRYFYIHWSSIVKKAIPLCLIWII
jgi:hypothetical protein